MVALAHNGNLVNAQVVRAELEAQGSIFSSSTDSEVIVHLIARSKSDDLVEATAEALGRLSGRLFPGDDEREGTAGDPGSARVPAALAGQARGRVGPGVGVVRLRSHRGDVRPRPGAGGVPAHHAARDEVLLPAAACTAGAVHLRVHLLRSPGQRALRPECGRRPQGAGAAAGRGGPGGRGSRDSRAGFRRAGGLGVCRAVRACRSIMG